MSNQHTPYIWMDGKIRPWSEGQVHIMCHTLHYGSGCFEGIKCYSTEFGPAIFRLRDHMERLQQSAALYGMSLPYPVTEMVAAVGEVVRANELDSCYIRPIAYYGYDSLGVHPKNCPVHMAIACFNWGAYLGEDGISQGVRVTLSSWRKFHHSSMPAIAKASGQYLNSLLAVQEAKKQGFDEALLLNMEGTIAEGSGQNLFLVKNSVLRTNGEKASILMGITRETILQVAHDLGLTIEIGDLTTEQLFEADEAFFTGTASEVTPIREVDGHQIGTGQPGEVTTRLRDQYFDIVFGRKPEYGHWLTFLNPQRDGVVLREQRVQVPVI
jgi:branched-chain amino acid aminotransferase